MNRAFTAALAAAAMSGCAWTPETPPMALVRGVAQSQAGVDVAWHRSAEQQAQARQARVAQQPYVYQTKAR